MSKKIKVSARATNTLNRQDKNDHEVVRQVLAKLRTEIINSQITFESWPAELGNYDLKRLQELKVAAIKRCGDAILVMVDRLYENTFRATVSFGVTTGVKKA